MTSDKTTAGQPPLGRAAFTLEDDQTLNVVLDRQGFYRLLRTLETLAAEGERQTFQKSGRQNRKKNGAMTKGSTLKSVIFQIEDDR